jgi:phospholipase C
MSDNSYDTVFGPSTPGALNLVSRQTHGATPTSASKEVAGDTLIGDLDPTFDDCDFSTALHAGDLPAVSFLKAAKYQDGHAGYSDPLDEQRFLVDTINSLQKSKHWGSTAVVIAYDDSDGWYDHQPSPSVNPSQSPLDALTTPGICGSAAPPLAGFQNRCGYGPRLPLLVILPFAKQNFVDHTATDQTSILRFVEDNWLSGERIGGGSFDALAGPLTGMFDFPHSHADSVILDPASGARTKG